MDVQHEIMRHAHAQAHTNNTLYPLWTHFDGKYEMYQFSFGFALVSDFFLNTFLHCCCTSIFIFNKIECDYILAPHGKKERHETGFQNKLTWNRFVQMKIGRFARARLFSFASFKFLRQFSFLFTLQDFLVLLSFCQLLFRFFIPSSSSFVWCTIEMWSQCNHLLCMCRALVRFFSFASRNHSRVV